MPELPEVETIKRAVEKATVGGVIERIEVHQRQFRNALSGEFEKQVIHKRIESFNRIGKYMIMNLNDNLSIVWHFGMSGKFKIESEYPEVLEKHDHIIIKTNRSCLIYHDPRRFGMVFPIATDRIKSHPIFNQLGLDPWDKKLIKDYLLKKLRHKRIAIKSALLDQKIICGIGNIYASEILYHARIDPRRASESITSDEAEKIISCTRAVLKSAIEAGGSTIHDYKRPDGDIGYFQQSHCVYNKKGLRCPECCCILQKRTAYKKSNKAADQLFTVPLCKNRRQLCVKRYYAFSLQCYYPVLFRRFMQRSLLKVWMICLYRTICRKSHRMMSLSVMRKHV